jgi:uncharacterized protein (TIRG00374 family)
VNALEKPARRISAWNIAFFILGLALLAGLLTQVDFSALLRQVLGVQPVYFLLGGLLYLVKTGLRALRYQRLNRQSKPALLEMLRLVLASSLASQLMPLKLGELAYVYLLRRGGRASVAQGVSSLLAARLFDLLAVALLFVLVTLAIGGGALRELSVYFNAILVFILALLAAIAAILGGARYGQKILAWVFALPVLRERPLPFVDKLRAALENLLAELAAYSPRDIAEWSLLAGLEWFVNYGAFHVLLLGIGLTPRFFDTVVCVTFAALASVLPLNSFGSFGTQEAGWAAGLLLMGYSRESAIASGFATHLLTLAYMLLLGGISWMTYLGPQGRAQK